MPLKVFSHNQKKKRYISPTNSGKFHKILNKDLKILIDNIVINQKMVNEYGIVKVKIAFRKKINETGLPFFSYIDYIQAINNIKDKDVQMESLLFEPKHSLTQFQFKLLIMTKNVNKKIKYNDDDDEDEDDEDDEDLMKKDAKEKFTCKLCLMNLINICILPCKHMCLCSTCMSKYIQNFCPFCKIDISKYIHLESYRDDDDDDDDNGNYLDDDDDDENIGIVKVDNCKSIKRKQKNQLLYNNNNNNTSSLLCKICYMQYVGVIFLPCKHISCCLKCYSNINLKIKICPQCETEIIKVIYPIIIS